MSVSFDVEGKVAVITGGAGVLCSEMSTQLGSRGAKVAVLDIAEEGAKEIAAKIVEDGGDAIGVGVDVLDKDSLLKARDVVMDK